LARSLSGVYQVSDTNNKEINPLDKFYLDKPDISKALIPHEIKTITDKTFKKALTQKHYKGEKEIKDLKLIGQDEPVDLGLVAIWESENVEYFIKQTDLAKLKNQAPKAYVSQDKNIKLLLALTEQQQFKNQEKKAECSFTLKEYAKLRGYTEEEIKAGGKFLTELKRDLITGACTTYRIDEIEINGKKYIAHGIPNFYILLEPKNTKGRWQVKFNAFYAESIIKILRKEAKQYFTHYLKEIMDRETTEKPYLHFFYNQLVNRRQTGETTMHKKVVNLLREMGVEKQVLERPKQCFEVLKKCLVFFYTKYPEELDSICFYNNFDKEKSLPLSSLKNLQDFEYKDFKKILKAKGIEDIREAYISFIRQSEAKKELLALKPQNNSKNNSELIDKILEWVDKCIEWNKMITLTREGTEKYLKDSLNILGFDRLNELFQQEAKTTYPNAIRFITKTLPEELKEMRKIEDLKRKCGANKHSDDEYKKLLEELLKSH